MVGELINYKCFPHHGRDCTGVCRRTSSLEITESGSHGQIPAPLNPDLMFSSVKILSWAALNPIKNSDLVMWLMEARMKRLISSPYARFNGENNPTSSGWSR